MGDPARPIESEEAGERIDRVLSRRLELPRAQIQRWIAAGRVSLDGRPVKASTPVEAGSIPGWEPPEAAPDPRIEPEAGPLAILYQDDDLVVLDKPAGLAVHPGAGRRRGTLAHRLLNAFPEVAGIGGPGRPGIVHRLDIDTTGVLAVARSERAYRQLSADFAARQVEKRYLAIVYGSPPVEGEVALPIGRHPDDRKKMAIREHGRPAHTTFRVLAAEAGIAALAVGLGTGRTHQIRVHLKAIGHPLVGDPVYGEARWRGLPPSRRGALAAFARPALHAWRLAFAHPADGRPLAFEAPLPADLAALWTAATGRPWPTSSGGSRASDARDPATRRPGRR